MGFTMGPRTSWLAYRVYGNDLIVLGEQIDIHAGGIDLCFPHHENEAAQCEVLTSKPFSRYWLHNGFINIDEEKMSKSLGNVYTVRELRERYSPTALRYFLLSVHYRMPMQFSEEILEQSSSSVERFKDIVGNLLHKREHLPTAEATMECQRQLISYANGLRRRWMMTSIRPMPSVFCLKL